ncbi:Protein of unknown function (DUF447) [Caldisphaera lagunensis DSM 15908]|uniref:DUF447 family protein n=1 Tax=Caldisphaera lagunensis (strain DSM 15908 / JCM 11604 / ANMR 0165 / IC-154) TaxID=1056495 RepID=L0AAJ7_CALLD|nr:DUF447 domain-containing protein [Caldisphaera lagunensis]AFZ70906.1 Protein of unknown function (DUF447) [Caldisphaera lagunensis DSM 15908]
MLKNIYYEFIAFTCNTRYSMPIGILFKDKPKFYVYKTTRLSKILNDKSLIYLLSPNDPLIYLKSLDHEIENEIKYVNGCPDLDNMGSVYLCYSRFLREDENGIEFECEKFEKIKGENLPYTRVYGCLVEMLILLTKIEANVIEDWFLDYAKGLKWCVERASKMDEKYVRISNEIFKRIERHFK